jgi:DNA-cytosine methyltransferase
MNVLSLFDGISCAYEALNRSQIKINTYYASEIDKNALSISTKNHSDIIRLGDVREIKTDSLLKVDLLIGGSPCQDLSIAKKDRKGLEGDRSGLFWEYVRIKNELNPKYFILENVASMSKTDKDIITQALGVEPIMFNASLVSAQSRKRLFWTNIKFDLPEDKNILLKDILEENVEERFNVNPKPNNSQANRVYNIEGKSVCLKANGGGGGAKTGLYKQNERIRKLTPRECFNFQGFPLDYVLPNLADCHLYKLAGNAVSLPVVQLIANQLVRLLE